MSSSRKVARVFAVTIAVVIVWRVASELMIERQRMRARRHRAADAGASEAAERGPTIADELDDDDANDGASDDDVTPGGDSTPDDGATPDNDSVTATDASSSPAEASAEVDEYVPHAEVAADRLQADVGGHARVDEWYRATMLRTFYVIGAMIGMLATVVAAVTFDDQATGSAIILTGGLMVVAACSYGILKVSSVSLRDV